LKLFLLFLEEFAGQALRIAASTKRGLKLALPARRGRR